MNLPVLYDDLSPAERRWVRESYVELQCGLCWYCEEPLSGPPIKAVAEKPVDRKRFPRGFFDWPVHLHHDKTTGLTVGAVHNYCNAVSFIYEETRMPVITKQSVKSKPRAEANGSASAWDLVDSLRVLLYGASGTGKTTLWATFPGPIDVAICSGGNRPGELRSVDTPENRKRIRPTIINTTDQFKAWLGQNDAATKVLDHATGFADLVLKEIIGADSLPVQKSWGLASQQQYGQLAMHLKEYFRDLLNFAGHVVIVSQERVFGGREDGMPSEIIQPTVGAALTPSVAGWLNPACDYVVQTFKRPKMTQRKVKVGAEVQTVTERGKGVEYCLRCEPHDVYMTKFRLPKGSRLIPDVIVDPSYEKILKVITG